MSEIDKIHDKFFRRVFSVSTNARSFLKFRLPESIQKHLDLDSIEIDPSSYVSRKYKDSMSDIVAKTRTKEERIPVDFYFLFEHKSYPDEKTPLQLLHYKYQMWEKDSDAKEPPRVIIPIVFYHGERKWKIPTRFVEQFPVPDELKRILLDFEYILFDTNDWDWQDESSQPLRENVFLLSAMLLMKAAYQQNLEIIRQVFRLWRQIGFAQEEELRVFMMIYIVETQDIPEDDLTIMLEESKIEGEDTMPTLAQRWEKRWVIFDKQHVLIMLLSTRFQLVEGDRQSIKTVSDAEKLDDALKMILTANSKDEVLDFLKNSQTMPKTDKTQ